ncbi:2Fe-2S iron-sulfur cluster-binding protein [Tsuneonella rigui]|uniref:2Fe-2S iron-sulfur cluster-binding protein n=1 Tax=Tsuneonella rigui TaxID=1708790 RepID=UPI001F4A03E3|nr:2Fe-2S iron-sulfur cluster-binding protein [Tsuneonella rigui]
MKINLTTREGDQLIIDGTPGLSLMENIRNAGIDEVLALCGGCCSCATCHVFVEVDAAAVLAPVSEDEFGLLDGSSHRNERSRLSCQVVITEAMDGMAVVIAPED